MLNVSTRLKQQRRRLGVAKLTSEPQWCHAIIIARPIHGRARCDQKGGRRDPIVCGGLKQCSGQRLASVSDIGVADVAKAFAEALLVAVASRAVKLCAERHQVCTRNGVTS